MRRILNEGKLFVGQWYLGSGSRISVFTRRPKRPFEEIRELYLMEIESANNSVQTKKQTQKKLSIDLNRKYERNYEDKIL